MNNLKYNEPRGDVLETGIGGTENNGDGDGGFDDGWSRKRGGGGEKQMR